ncbi:SRPBCC domain-containing protein [Streptomyces sp. NPDC012888]|uniref:SRPBCC domain-containing protein n=1 Tax=Streptomyces sp. NPDC012888 TaxID=3364855 RepID=UPI0036B3B972
MEHQVFVPVSVSALRAVLRDPVRLVRCVPGLQQDADAEAGPLAGRLRLRVGGSTVTYRGALAVTERDEDTFVVSGEGTEARGTGNVKVLVELRLAPAEGGTRLEFTAGATAEGRAAAFDPVATVTTVQRLLDRAADQLLRAAEDGRAGAAAPDRSDDASRAGAGTADTADTDTDTDDTADVADVADAGAAPGPDGLTGPGSVFEAEVPPSSLDPFLGGDFAAGLDEEYPPAEAAHARRTMIGRSAEEVDHAPPRGRYAPVPAPDATTTGSGLRWLAPAAAVALAGAVVVGRALRRRRV